MLRIDPLVLHLTNYIFLTFLKNLFIYFLCLLLHFNKSIYLDSLMSHKCALFTFVWNYGWKHCQKSFLGFAYKVTLDGAPRKLEPKPKELIQLIIPGQMVPRIDLLGSSFLRGDIQHYLGWWFPRQSCWHCNIFRNVLSKPKVWRSTVGIGVVSFRV